MVCIPDQQHPVLSVHELLSSWVLGPTGQYLGYVYDIVIRPRDEGYPLVAGLLVCIGYYESFLPVSAVTTWQHGAVRVGAAPGIQPLEDRENLLLLRSDLFDLWVTDPTGSRGVRIRELLLQHTSQGWVVTTSDARARLVRRAGGDSHDGLVDGHPGSPATDAETAESRESRLASSRHGGRSC